MKLMIINGSLGGPLGNTAKIIDRFCEILKQLSPHVDIDLQHLKLGANAIPSMSAFEQADAFLFTSGVYWDSWGSPLQNFFENLTILEGTTCFIGKPPAALVSMHSVGGKEVLSRLQGVLNTFGFYFPPMGAMTYSYANQAALNSNDLAIEKDLWCLDDLHVLAKNLMVAHTLTKGARRQWSTWPVDREDPRRIWIETVLS